MSNTDQNTTLGGRVLVVDDNPLITKVLSGILEEAGYKTNSCSNGLDALCELEKNTFDLILCDVMMPKMDGHNLYASLQGNSEFAGIPFIFLTALDSDFDKNKGKEAGVDDYLVKPFKPEEVLAVVKGKLKRSKIINNSSKERYDAYRKKVIHTLSHEFRTPLVAINTGAELLESQVEDIEVKEKFSKLLKAIRRGGERLESLVNDFMLVQQIEAGVAERMFNSRKEIKSVKVLEEFAIQEKLKYEKIDYTFSIKNLCRDDLKVEIYEIQIYDVIKRLIANAVKFQKNKKEIGIRIHSQSNEIVFSVIDNGLGINIERAMEALAVFGQINRDKLEQQGGGFGLSIANQYLLIHGGKLEFENRKEDGSIVSFTLPRC